jgi:tetratricopeptide (TPR) repeat protein
MKRKTVSLCMIARDEEAFIGKAIKSVLALVDEIVVVDTGSRDNTRIIAEGYGARVIDDAWHDDFAAARNTALAAASSDWILILDCDEQLQSVRPVEFQRLLIDPGIAGYRVRTVGAGAGERSSPFPDIRLFRSHPDVRYRYPVHEQIAPSLTLQASQDGLVIADSPLVVVHDGGSPDQRSRKRDRNLRLLRQAVLDYPEEAYFEYRLGSETLLQLDGEVLPVAGLRSSLDHLASAWRKVAALPPEMRSLVAYGKLLAGDLAAAQLAIGQAADAARTVALARAQWGESSRLVLEAVRARLAALQEEQDPELTAAIRRDLDLLSRRTVGDTSLLAVQVQDCHGELALCEGRVSEAAEFFEQALSLDQEHAAAWVGLADCARLAGDRKRALRLYLRAVTANEWSVRAWRRGCSLMEELGFHDNAQSWRDRVREHFPECPAVESGIDTAAAGDPCSDAVRVGQLLP